MEFRTAVYTSNIDRPAIGSPPRDRMIYRLLDEESELRDFSELEI